MANTHWASQGKKKKDAQHFKKQNAAGMSISMLKKILSSCKGKILLDNVPSRYTRNFLQAIDR